jgi:hypothetical protein
MATATLPADLVRDAELTLTAARVAVAFAAAHPELPIARMHAGPSGARTAPLLEVQLDEDLDALARFADTVNCPATEDADAFGTPEYTVELVIDGVTVTVTAYASPEG